MTTLIFETCRQNTPPKNIIFSDRNFMEFLTRNTIIYKHNHHHHQSVLPKGRSFSANSGTKAVVLSGGRSSTANQGCSFTRDKWVRSFPLFSASHSLFSISTDLKRSDKIPEAPTWRWEEWMWLTEPSGLHRNSTQGLRQGVLPDQCQWKDQQRSKICTYAHYT